MIPEINLQLFAQEKKEPATFRRRQMAREKGQVALSSDLVSAAGFLAGVVALKLTLDPVAKYISARAGAIWSAPSPTEVSIGWAFQVLREVMSVSSLAVLPLVLSVMTFGVVASVAQTGIAFRPNLLTPDLDRLNPISGIARLFSRRALAAGLRSILKMILVGLCAYCTLKNVWPEVSSLVVRDLSSSLRITRETVEGLALNCGLFLLILGVADRVYQWWEYERSIMMTPRELRDEMRDAEVKPEIRSAMRARQRSLARRRMMQDVKTSDAVIVNPEHYAVAVKYDASTSLAPTVVAKGLDDVALRIREVAKENHVQVVQNPPLARALYKASDIGEMIPEELYKAVAEVLAYVYRVSGKAPGGEGGK
jgi:flagellar biosynthetic protein FlhB